MPSGWRRIGAPSARWAASSAFRRSCTAPTTALRRRWRCSLRWSRSASLEEGLAMTLGPFLFGAPWALAALGALPLLWWLMRATPPPPQRAQFPPARLLQGLRTDDQSRERAPWWLFLFRALAAALLILAFARPSLAPTAAESL